VIQCVERFAIAAGLSSNSSALKDYFLLQATDPKAKNEAYNVVNGDVFRYKRVWRLIAEYFGIEVTYLSSLISLKRRYQEMFRFKIDGVVFGEAFKPEWSRQRLTAGCSSEAIGRSRLHRALTPCQRTRYSLLAFARYSDGPNWCAAKQGRR
jgi:hypothetical protein